MSRHSLGWLPILGAVASCTSLDDVLGGLERFMAVSVLIDDVSFLPLAEGRRTTESTGPTLVAPSVNAIEIVFLETLDPASVAGFSPERNLRFEGVSPDPARPAFLNTAPIGRIRTHQVLTVPLASPLPEGGPFRVTLVSSSEPDGNVLRTLGQPTPYLGTYDVAFQVVARDGSGPVVERLVTSAGVTGAISLQDFAAGPIRIAYLEPHAPVRIEFSEEMRPGVPVLVSPTLPVQEERSLDGRTFRFFRPTSPGLNFVERLEGVGSDPPRTVLTTLSDEVRPIDVEFEIRIPSDSSLALQTTLAVDLSGEPLVPFLVPEARFPADYAVLLQVSAVEITSPDPGDYLNGAALAERHVSVRGFVGAGIRAPTLSIIDPDGAETAFVETEFTGPETPTLWGRVVRPWLAEAPGSAFDAQDGEYTLRAQSQRGSDSIQLLVDTVPPQLLGAAGTLDVYANDSDRLDRICVAVGGRFIDLAHRNDADRAELVLPDGTALESNHQETFEDDDGVSRFGFCWANVDLGSSLPVGRTNLTVRLYDLAANVGIDSIEIRVHPWIESVTPDQVPFGLFDKREIEIRGVGFKKFAQSQGDAVRIDERDLAVTIQKDVVFGPPLDFILRLDVPEDAAPGPLTVRIDGLESNRFRFEVCREEAAKYVTDLHFDDRPAPFGPGQLSFSMERGPTGEPVFVWTTTGGVGRASADGNTYVLSRDADGLAPVDVGAPIQALRLPDGTVASVWLSGFRLYGFGLPGVASNFSIPLSGPGIPVALDAAVDTEGTPYALVVSSIGSTIPLTVVDARLFRLDGTDATGTLVGSFTSQTRTAFSGRLAFGKGGSGWVLASGSETRAWYRRGTTWTESPQVFPDSVVADVSASRDGRQFFTAIWKISGDAEELAREQQPFLAENVAGKLQLFSAGRVDSEWESVWTADTVFEPRAFLPPLTNRPDGYEGRFALAHAAAVRVSHQNRAILAYTDFQRRTLRLAHVGALAPDVLDLDVTIGQRVSLTLDGNDQALVGYADLSHATTLEQVEEDRKKGIRGTASIQLLDTRNRHAVMPGVPGLASVCSPGKFRVSSIAKDDWSHIRDHQATRTRFEYDALYKAFVGEIFDPSTGEILLTTEQEVALRGKQASAAVFSRLLSKGSIRFRGRDLSGGDQVSFTADEDNQTRAEEFLGIRVPLGTTAASVATFDTPDGSTEAGDRIGRFHIARFKPTARSSDCVRQPEPETDATMAYAPGGDFLVLFGGRGKQPEDIPPSDPNNLRPDDDGVSSEDGDFLFTATWVMNPGAVQPCWTGKTHSTSPAPRVGHTMIIAPSGRGVLLFGGRDSDGDLLDDVWLFDPKVGADGTWTQLSSGPSGRRQAAIAYDPVREQIWLFGGRQGATFLNDLWVGALGTTGDIVWTPAGNTMPDFPFERSDASLVFEPFGDQLILFGGRRDLSVGPVSNDLWSYRIDPDPLSGEWHELAGDQYYQSQASDGTHIGRARGGAAAIANVDSTLVVFAGTTQGVGFRPVAASEPPRLIAGNGMDILDLKLYQNHGSPPPMVAPWSFKVDAFLPPAREHQAWAADGPGRQLFVFGGESLGVTLNDTLVYDLKFGAEDGFWKVVVPGDAEPIDALAEGKARDGERVQWGRGDFLPLMGIEGLADALTALAPKEFPPLGTQTVRINSFDLGPLDFDRLLALDAGASDEQGTLESHVAFGTLEAKGTLSSGILSIPFTATTDIPTSTFDPGFGLPPIVILRPDLCTLFLDAGHLPEALVRKIPMEASLNLQPAVDSRGPTAEELDDEVLALQSHTKLVGVTVSVSETLKVPICIQVPGGNELELVVLGPILASVARTMAGRVISLPATTAESPGRGILDDLAGAVVVDAFTNHGPDFGVDYEDRRTRSYRSLNPVPGCPRDDPEWVHMHPGGVSLGLRGQGGDIFEVACGPLF